MADGHFTDVELLRRELATLVLEWAGKAVKDDPESPMSTALTRAVGEAARSAVAEQHQALAVEAADRIAEALERRDKAGGLVVWRLRRWVLGLVGVAGAALLAVAFLLGLQTGRTESAVPPPTTTAAVTAPIAPLAPSAEEAASSSSDQPAKATAQQPAIRPERTSRSTAPSASRPPRELGRPAQASDGAASRSAQPVGAATTTTTTTASTPTPPSPTTP